MMWRQRIHLLPAAVLIVGTLSCGGGPSDLRFEVVVPGDMAAQPVDGRVLLLVSSTDDPEPRLQRLRSLDTPMIFGIDVDGLAPGEPAVIDSSARGFPFESIVEIPPGEYFVQAVLNVYTTFARADGHTIKAHMDQWEGQQWNRSPGNLYSPVERVAIDPASGGFVSVALSEKIPPLDPPKDTKYVKHIKFRSDILSDWWGHDIHLGAVIVLPEGFEEHPETRYPVVYWHGHFPATFTGFQEEPPDPNLTGQDRERAAGRHSFFQDWVSGKLGRFLIVLMQHPTPFYDDSYAVNSENNGPYGERADAGVDAESRGAVSRHRRAVGTHPGGWLDRGVGITCLADLLSRHVQRYLDVLSGSGRLPLLSARQHLRRRQRLLSQFDLGRRVRSGVPTIRFASISVTRAISKPCSAHAADPGISWTSS